MFGFTVDSGSSPQDIGHRLARGSPVLDSRMKVTVNGEPREVPPDATVRTLIETLGLAGKACAAEVNAELVPFRRHSETALHEGDRVEIVTLVGGG